MKVAAIQVSSDVQLNILSAKTLSSDQNNKSSLRHAFYFQKTLWGSVKIGALLGTFFVISYYFKCI